MTKRESLKKLKEFKGGLISWMFGDKRYYGKKKGETSTHILATTHNGKTKKIPKKGMA